VLVKAGAGMKNLDPVTSQYAVTNHVRLGSHIA